MKNSLLSRREDGKLVFQSLDFEILIGDLFCECMNEKETNWLEQQLSDIVEIEAEKKRDEIESE